MGQIGSTLLTLPCDSRAGYLSKFVQQADLGAETFSYSGLAEEEAAGGSREYGFRPQH
jgi:hypothetical protein